MTYRYEAKDSIVVHSDASYKGEHNPHEVFCVIKWCIADLLDAMDNRGIELTDENIDRAIDAVDYLQDRSIELGWEVMDTLLGLEF